MMNLIGLCLWYKHREKTEELGQAYIWYICEGEETEKQ